MRQLRHHERHCGEPMRRHDAPGHHGHRLIQHQCIVCGQVELEVFSRQGVFLRWRNLGKQPIVREFVAA